MNITVPAGPATALGHLLPRLARFATNRLDEGDQSLSLAQFYVLGRIADGVRRGVDLARRSGVRGATMSGIVDRLVAAGFASREADPADRRSYALNLTEAGRRALEDGDRRLVEGVSSLLRSAPQADRDAVARACAAIERALDARVAEVTK